MDSRENTDRLGIELDRAQQGVQQEEANLRLIAAPIGRTPRTLQLGKIHLTGALFRQIVGGIKRLACRPLEGGRRLTATPATRRVARVTENNAPMPKALYEKRPDFVARRIADEVVLVPISRNVGEIDCLYALNEVAARVWDLIDRRSFNEVRDTIVEAFEVSEITAQEDLAVLIEQLKEIGAIQEVP